MSIPMKCQVHLINRPIHHKFSGANEGQSFQANDCCRAVLFAECNQLVSVAPYTKVTASTHPSWSRKTSCQPDNAEVFGHRAWCPRHTDTHQWLQFDLGPPILVTGIVTKGRPDTKRLQWVTAYTITYSNDSLVWYTYKESNHLHSKPFVARFVRVHPAAWSQGIGLRSAVIGCPHRGPCPLGFLRVTGAARCGESTAQLQARRRTRTSARHGWKDWTYGNSALAVDGDKDASLSRCAILDNYYVEQPIWMVDLGWQEPVLGVILTTWQGIGQDKNILYHDYLLNLDRLTVYVSDRPRLEAYQLSPVPEGNVSRCTSVSRAHSALFQPRLHFDCGQTLTGRYVYVKAAGVANRWNQLFSAVLCEVEVY
ncbi:Neurexin-4 [Gryllus bimaculatus]|nr:Neurexin-4 [Gryllus bimaculatus]